MRTLLDALKHIMSHEDDAKMRRIAHRYDLRRHMDGDVVRKTGEIIPRQSA